MSAARLHTRQRVSQSNEEALTGNQDLSAEGQDVSASPSEAHGQDAAAQVQARFNSTSPQSILTRSNPTSSSAGENQVDFQWNRVWLLRAINQFRSELYEQESLDAEQSSTAIRSLRFLTQFRNRIFANLPNNPQERHQELNAILFCDRTLVAFRRRHRLCLQENRQDFEANDQLIMDRIEESKELLRALRNEQFEFAQNQENPMAERLAAVRLAFAIDEELNNRENKIQDLDLWYELLGASDLSPQRTYADLGQIMTAWHQLRQYSYDRRSQNIEVQPEQTWGEFLTNPFDMVHEDLLPFVNPLGWGAQNLIQAWQDSSESAESEVNVSGLSLSEGQITERMRNIQYSIQDCLPELHEKALPQVETGLSGLVNSDPGAAPTEFEGVLEYLSAEGLQNLIQQEERESQALLALRFAAEEHLQQGHLSMASLEGENVQIGANPHAISQYVHIGEDGMEFTDAYSQLEVQAQARVLNSLVEIGIREGLAQRAAGVESEDPAFHFHQAREALAEGNLDSARLELVIFLRGSEDSDDPDIISQRQQARTMNLALQEQTLTRMEELAQALHEQRDENMGNLGEGRNQVLREALINEIRALLQDESANLYTVGDALESLPGTLEPRAQAATQAFIENPEITAGQGVNITLGMFGSQGVPGDVRRVDEIREAFLENPEVPLEGLPTIHLNGGMLLYRNAGSREPISSHHRPFLRVRIGAAGGIIRHRGYVYHFQPSQEERWVLLETGRPDYVGPGELPPNTPQIANDIGAPIIDTSLQAGHPNYARELLRLFDGEGHLNDPQLQAYLNYESEGSIRERLDNPEVSRHQSLALARSLRGLNGSDAMAEAIFLELMAPEIETIRNGFSEADLRTIDGQVQEARSEIVREIHSQVVDTHPRPTQRQVDQMIEVALDFRRTQLTERLGYSRLSDRYDAGEITDPIVGQAWSEFNDMRDPLDETGNLADSTWREVINFITQEAMLLVLTAGAGLVTAPIRTGARVIATSAARSWMARTGVNLIARRASVWAGRGGARSLLGRTTLRLMGQAANQSSHQIAARLGIWTTETVAHGSAFELAMMGMESTLLGQGNQFADPQQVMRRMGRGILMMGAIGAGNSLWGRVANRFRLTPAQVQRMAGIGSTEMALRQGANWTGALVTELNMLTLVTHANGILFGEHGPEGSLLEQYAHNLRMILGLRLGHRMMGFMTGHRMEQFQRRVEAEIQRDLSEAMQRTRQERIEAHRSEINSILRELTGDHASGEVSSNRARFLRWVLEQSVAQTGSTEIANYLRSPEGMETLVECAQALRIGEANPGVASQGLARRTTQSEENANQPADRATQLIMATLMANATHGATTPAQVARRLRDYRRHLRQIAEPIRQLAAEVESNFNELLASMGTQATPEIFHLFQAQFASHIINEGMSQAQVRELLTELRAGRQRFEIQLDPETGQFNMGFRDPHAPQTEVVQEDVPVEENIPEVSVVDEVPAGAIDVTPGSQRPFSRNNRPSLAAQNEVAQEHAPTVGDDRIIVDPPLDLPTPELGITGIRNQRNQMTGPKVRYPGAERGYIVQRRPQIEGTSAWHMTVGAPILGLEHLFSMVDINPGTSSLLAGALSLGVLAMVSNRNNGNQGGPYRSNPVANDEEIEILRTLIRRPFSQERQIREIVENLGKRRDPRAVPILMDIVFQDRPWYVYFFSIFTRSIFEDDTHFRRELGRTQEVAMEALGNIGGAEVIDPLLNYITTPNYPYFNQRFHDSVLVLAKTRDPEVIENLSRIVHNRLDFTYSHRLEIITSLAYSSEHWTIDIWLRLLKNPDEEPDFRIMAAKALGWIGTPRTMDTLIQYIADPNSTVRIFAIRALGEAQYPQLPDALLPILNGSDPELRAEAAYSLRNFPQDRVENALRERLNDTDPEVQEMARIALDIIRNPSKF